METLDDAYERLKENELRLQNCKQHYFGTMPMSVTPATKLLCIHCGGEMRAPDMLRYCQGFEAAGGDPETILHDYKWLTRR